ncbi:hypothetical protein NDU88_005005 [Pleurodeles waltl]|uniref:Uncharacterized protein n=1 Tax=Pleurodeles waltl TaxID=8319 RepID=A0AAV7NPA4_PLEWA|nr:hypothetical protein NDU88_005005 [Pleurodeles waltl]
MSQGPIPWDKDTAEEAKVVCIALSHACVWLEREWRQKGPQCWPRLQRQPKPCHFGPTAVGVKKSIGGYPPEVGAGKSDTAIRTCTSQPSIEHMAPASVWVIGHSSMRWARYRSRTQNAGLQFLWMARGGLHLDSLCQLIEEVLRWPTATAGVAHHPSRGRQ